MNGLKIIIISNQKSLEPIKQCLQKKPEAFNESSSDINVEHNRT